MPASEWPPEVAAEWRQERLKMESGGIDIVALAFFGLLDFGAAEDVH